ncbi:Hypothetical protein D9617_27g045140 [Elsinoe fawcettii]|nr:Hypothetical protein D9617_27g045140 [Elsinoe fawcettii]
MFSKAAFLSSLLVSSVRFVSGAAVAKRAPAPFSDFTRNEFFKPAADANLWGTLYARSLQLPDESLLMTWENYPKEPPLVNHPIFRSTDGGATWSNYSAVYDQVNGWGMRFQPFLYTLPTAFGGFPAGTILASGVSTRESLQGGTWIEVYASTDQAKTFNFVSHITYGDGPNTIKDGDKALWEPFFLMYNGQLVVYYSDQRDPNHSQKLVHQTTRDLKSWSTPVEDAVEAQYSGRPGMTTIAYIAPTKKYIMTYELCGVDNCNVHYKLSTNPLAFASAPSIRLQATDGSIGTSGPYVIWTSNPAKTDGSGVIIVSSSNREQVWLNADEPVTNGWRLVDINHWSAYSRSLRIITLKGKKKLFLGNGGNFGPKENNGVACAVVNVPY